MSTIRFQISVLMVGCLLGIAKFTAYFITHSNSIFSDALESIVNIIAGGFALYSLYLSALPRDENHPYGHGKVEFISSSIEGSMIAISGITVMLKAIYGLFNPAPIHQLDIGIIIITAAGLFNYMLGLLTQSRAKKINSPALMASATHLKTDGYTSLGLIAGLGLLYFTKLNWIDQAVALIFSIVILYQGLKILRASVAGIMDETDEWFLRQIVEALNKQRKDEWIDIHNFRVIKYGASVHIDAHLTLPWYYNNIEIHHEVKELNKVINQFNETDVEMFVHTDPCEPWSCSICSLKNCSERKNAFVNRIQWTLENVSKDQKHQM